MKKVLLRTLSALTIVAVMFSTISSNARPTDISGGFIALNDAVLNSKEVTDAPLRKRVIAPGLVTNKPVAGFLPVSNVSSNREVSNISSAAAAPFFAVNNSQTTCTTGKAIFTYDNGVATSNFQSFIVPNNVTSVTIEAYGANGGNAPGVSTSGPENGTGGVGAYVSGKFSVSSGDVLTILTGQKGGDASVGADFAKLAAGGGGGSFVSKNDANFSSVSNLLLAAGGGGGGGYGLPQSAIDKNANTDTYGYYGSQTSLANPFPSSTSNGGGGTLGAGGINGNNSGGGAGFLSDGVLAIFKEQGLTPNNGGDGGWSFDTYDGDGNYSPVYGYGGYGGGGASILGGGGGGGFSGGGGGKDNGFGGGGGSYVGTTIGSPTLTALANTSSSSYYQGGNGVVIITWTIPVPVMNVFGNSTLIPGNSTNTPVVADNTDFGSTAPNVAVSETYTIKNNASKVNDLVVSAISTNNGFFALDASSITLPATIPAGGSITFKLKYTPTAAGSHTAVVTLTSNDCVSSPYKYNVKGSASSGCVNPTPPTGSDNSRCGTGTVTISATAGTGETIDWYAAATGGSALATSTTSFTTPSINTTTVYYAEARNISGSCVSATRTPVTATVNTPVTPTFTQITPICSGASLLALPTTSTNGISGTWSPVLNNTATTAYTFTPTAGQCATTATMTITVNPLPSATISGTTTVCKGSTSPNITFTGSNGTAPYTFTYTINGGTQQTVTTISGNSVQVPVSTSTAGSFVYQLVSVQESSSNACVASVSGASTVTINTLPNASIIGGTIDVCQNQTSPNITFTGVNGVAPYTFSYQVNGGATQQITTVSGNSVTLPVSTSTAGTFVYSLLSVKDGSSTTCTNGAGGIATVIVHALVTPSFTQVPAICAGATLSALPTTSIEGITGTWSPAINNTATTTYTFTPTAGQCANTATMTITVNANPSVGINPASANICSGNSVGLSTSNGLIGYWKFDEGSGSTAADASGNNLTATFQNGSAWTTSSAFAGAGNAATFSSSGRYMTVNDNAIFNTMQTHFTIEAWIFQTDAVNNAIIDRGDYNFLLQSKPNGQPGLGFYNNGTWTYSTSSLPTNTWVHVACTWDGSTNTIRFYTNGILTDVLTRAPLSFGSGGPVNIGRQSPYTCACNIMDGSIDELRVWNVVKSAAELLASKNAALSVSSVGASYTWSPSAGLNTTTGSSVVASPASTTTYTVTATANGCTATSHATITVNAGTTPTFTQVAAICSGATLSALPTTSIEGITGTWSPAINNTATTTYTFTPTAGQCATTASMTIIVNALPNAPTGTNAASCAPNGVTISATGAAGETIKWYNAVSGGSPISVGNTLNTNVSGTFYAEAVSAAGCASAARTAVTAAVNPVPVISGGAAAICINGTTTFNGSGTPAAVNPWVSSDPSIASVDNNGVVTGHASGSVQIMYTTSGGCTAITNIFVSGFPGVGILPAGSAAICAGSSVTLNSNSEGGLTYVWTPGGSTNSSITVNSAGTYTLTGTNAYGCASSASVIVTVNALPNAPIGTNASGCAPFGVTISASGAAGETINWYAAATGGTPLATGNNFNTNISGTFYAEAVSAAGCVSATRTAVTATINPLPSSTVTAGGATDLCFGGSVVLSAPTGTGYTYQWHLNANDISGAMGSTYAATQAGIYTVTVTTPAGCSATTNDGGVTVTTTLQPHISTGITTFCNGSSSTLQADPVTGVTYQWQKDGVNISGATGSSYNATASGSYTLIETKTSGSGCSATSNAIVITVNPAPAKPTISGALTFCSTGSNFTTLTSSPAAGYHWSNGPLSQTTNVNTSGSYFVTITDANGCQSSSDPVTVTANPQPNSFNVLGGGSYCSGGSGIALTLSGSEVGVNYTLQLNNVSTGVVVAGTGSGISFGNVLTAGTYSVLATNATTGCTRMMNATPLVTVNPTPAVFTVTGGGSYCSGGNGLPVGLSGSETGVNYTLFRDAINLGSFSGTGSALSFGNRAIAGTFTVVAKNATTNCSANMSGSAVVSINPLPNAISYNVTDNCSGTITLTATNLVAGNSILWNTGARVNPTFVTVAGVYSAVQTDANGCTSLPSSTPVNTPRTTPPTPSIGVVDNCDGTSTLTALGIVGGFHWSTGVNNVSPITVNTAGTYTLQQTVNGCPSGIASATASPKTTPTATVTADGPTSVCPGITVSLHANTGSGYTYQWLKDGNAISGATSADYVASTTGTYFVKITSNGCTSQASNFIQVTVQDIVAPVAPVIPAINSQCGPVAVNAPVAMDDCAGPVTGTTTDATTYSTQGDHAITWTFTDPSGNSSTAVQHVIILDVTAPVPVCPSDITLTATPTVNGYGASYDYSNAATATDNCAVQSIVYSPSPNTFFGLGTHPVTVTVTDVNGLTAQCTFNVIVNPGPIDAVDDDYTSLPINGAKGGTTPVVLTNDLLNNASFDISRVNLTLVNDGGINGLAFDATGALIIPAGTWEGDYSVVYRICEKANPTNCDQAVVRIRIARGLRLIANSYCNNDVPYVHYEVIPNFTPDATLPVTLTWLNGDGSPVAAQPVLTGLGLTGDILWPGAVLDAQGQPVDWPGWFIQNGIWVQGADGFEGTRPNAYLQISVNPTETIQVSYPPATPGCSSEPFNRPPVAYNDIATTEKCNGVNISVLSNDADFENGALTVSVSSATSANGGTVVVNNDGTITYTPASGFFGSDNFSYTVTDPAGLTATATVTIDVVDHTPPVVPVLPVINGECSATVPAATTTDPCGGTVTGTTSDVLVYDAQGEYDVHWTFNDGHGNTSTAIQHVIVKDVTKPTFTCPSDIVVSANATDGHGVDGYFATYAATNQHDNCGILSTTYSIPSGSFFAVGTTTAVVVTVRDVNGNAQTCTFNVTVNCVAPVITSTPVDQTLNTTLGRCDAPATYTVTASGIPAANLSYSFAGATTGAGSGTGSGSVFNKGTTTVTVTATNMCGSVSTSFKVTVVDNEFPVITGVPANISQSNDEGKCGAVVNWTKPVSTDNCPGVIQTCDHKSGDFFPVGNTTVTVTATDAGGNVTTQTFTVTVTDNEKPTFTCPSDIVVAANAKDGHGVDGYYATYGVTDAHDNCGTTTTTYSITPGSFFPIGNTPVVVTVTDSHGNAQTCTLHVIVNCVAPVITSTVNQTINTTLGRCDAPATYTVTASGIPSANLSYSFTGATTGSGSGIGSGSIFNKGVTAVTVTATNMCGSVSTSFTVTVADLENPVIVNTPVNITKTNDAGKCGAVVNWTLPTATDNCPVVTLTSNYPSGYLFPVGTTTVVYTATDASNNTSTSNFTVTVTDNTPPTINCPSDINVMATTIVAGTSGTYVSYSATAYDICGGSPTVTYSPASGSFFPAGTTAVTVTAKDAAGNIATCKFNVIVGCVSPVLTLSSTPTNNTYTGGNPNSLYLGYGAQSTTLNVSTSPAANYSYSWSGDGASMLNSTTSSIPVFTPAKAGSYLFTVVVTNTLTGCKTTGYIAICVTDIRVPVITKDDNDDNQKMCDHTSHDSSDCPHKGHNHSCDHKAHSKYNCAHKDTNDKDDDDEKDCDHKAHDAKDCPHVGHNHKACDHKAHAAKDCDHDKSHSGDDQKVCDHKAHDASNCSHNGHHHGACNHKAHDAKDCPHNGGHADADDDDNNNHQQYGNSGNYKVFLCHVPPGNPGKTITLSISINAVAAHLALHPGDRLGSCEQAPCSGFADNVKPVIECPGNISVNYGASTLPAVTGSAEATDNSGLVDIIYNDVTTKGTNASQASYYNYTITRTWRATDPNGNFSECNQVITVKDISKPVITCPGNKTVSCSSNTGTAYTGVATAYDGSGAPVTVQNIDVTNGNTITRTWVATDVSGNVSTCTQMITVVDNIAPVITCPGDKVVACGGSTAPAYTGTATATDNCSAVTITYTDNNCANGVITRTWKATDASGNFSTCVQTITKPVGNPCALPYPLVDVNYPRSSVVFNESEILRATDPGPGSVCGVTPTQIKLWFNDEHPFTLGVRQVVVKTKTGTSTTNYPVTAYPGTASTVTSPLVGTTADNTSDQSGNDIADAGGRPLRPVLYISDITNDPNNRTGDWQHNGTPYNANRISGSWKSAVRVVDKTRTPAVVTVIPDADPAVKNNWNMGAGGDVAPSGLVNQGFGAEIVWNVSALPLLPGHTYRLQFMVHDGDQNKAGGDAGQACTVIYIPVGTTITATEAPKQAVTSESEVVAKTTEEDLKVTVMPNPSTTFFTLKIESRYQTPVELRVMDGRGRVVDAKSRIGANSTIQIGHNYSSGTYYAELIQGTKRKVVQLIKGRG